MRGKVRNGQGLESRAPVGLQGGPDHREGKLQSFEMLMALRGGMSGVTGKGSISWM